MGVTPEPDVAQTRRAHRTAYRDPLVLLLIGLGGTVGTGTRAVLENLVHITPGQWPWMTFVINLSGAFLLGCLLEALAHRADAGGWRLLRLTLGTGFLGGYTTYSTFAVEALQAAGAVPLVGVGYAVSSVVLGVLAAGCGMAFARAVVPSTREASR